MCRGGFLFFFGPRGVVPGEGREHGSTMEISRKSYFPDLIRIENGQDLLDVVKTRGPSALGEQCPAILHDKNTGTSSRMFASQTAV